MTIVDPSTSECDLCEEIRMGGYGVTGREYCHYPQETYSRLVQRTSVVDVLAGLGALIPGYVLLMPRRHVRSLGELGSDELQHVIDTAWKIAYQMTQIFGGSFALVEHGSSGTPDRPSGACIEHAHLHVFPLDSGIDNQQFRLPGSKHIDDISELQALAHSGRNYYFCGTAPDKCYLIPDPDLASQHARRIWAATVGKDEEWDWAVYPRLANVRLTANKLRRDDLPLAEVRRHLGDAELAETLEAYNSAAREYASRTQRFPAGSTLKPEMDWLASHTAGAILDAGTGGGRDARYFARSGRAVVALDASAMLLQQFPGQENLVRLLGDVRHIPVSDESFGAIWCSAVLLHLGRDDVVRSLREFYRVLTRNGLVEVSVKEGSGHSSSLMAGMSALRRHFFFYEERDLRQFARLADFRVLRVWAEEEIDSSAIVQRWIKVLLEKPDRDNSPPSLS